MSPWGRLRSLPLLESDDPPMLLENEAVAPVDGGEQGQCDWIDVLGHMYVHVGGTVVILLVGHVQGNFRQR